MNRPTLFSIIFLALVCATAACDRYERMVDQESFRHYEIKMPGVVPGAVPVDGGESRYRLAPEGSLANPIPAGFESIARGRVCYTFYCVQCHGSRYNGDGTVGQSFSPLPSDLRSPEVQQMSPDALFRSISYGGKRRQPPLAYTVAVEDRWHLINWIHSLGIRKDWSEPIPSGDYPLP